MPANPRTPAGEALENGFQCAITLADDPDISFFEISVKPPGMDGGAKIDTTTQHNVGYRTYAARVLKELTDAGATVAYDPAVLPQIFAQINNPQVITIHFPNGDTYAFDGNLQSFEPGDMEEGSRPTATIVIAPLMTDTTTGDGSENDPTFTAAS